MKRHWLFLPNQCNVFLTFSFFLLITFLVSAQKSQIDQDSLISLRNRSLSDSGWFAYTYLLGREYNHQAENHQGRELANEMLSKAKNKSDSRNQALSYRLLADYYYRKHVFDSSLFSAFESYKIAEQIADKPAQVNSLADIAIAYFSMQEYAKSIDVCEQALPLLSDVSLDEQTRIHGQLANALTFAGRSDEAIAHFQHAESLSLQLGDSLFLPLIYGNWGIAYFFLGDYQKSIEYYRRGFLMNQALNSQSGMATALINIGEAYGYLGQYENALKNLKQGLSTARSLQDRNVIRSAMLMLSDIYELQGDYQSSLSYYKSYVALSDSLFNESRKQQVADMEVRFETDKQRLEITSLQKDRELDSLKIENEKSQKLGFALTSGFLLIISGFTFYGFVKIQKSKRALNAQNKVISKINDQLTSSQEELVKSNATKDKFFALIAHDLRGPIASLQGIGRMLDFYLDKGKNSEVRQLINQVDKSSTSVNHLLDNLLKWALSQTKGLRNHPSKFKLKNLVTDCRAIFDESLKSKEIVLEVKMDESVCVFADYNMVSTILRNLVSNAIKFTPNGGRIQIEVEHQGAFAKIGVRDSGVGMSREQLQTLFELTSKTTTGTAGEKGTGLGLMLCAEFVKINQGEIRVETKEGEGSNFIFTLPVTAPQAHLE